ncbi:glycosyltransferase family 4 protein [bacterium]|nr:glycosyltransferase family 4 protein [bacterium]
MLDRDWNIHIVCDKSKKDQWEYFPRLAAQNKGQTHVHVNWPSQPIWLAGLLLPLSLIRALFTAPGPTYRYLVQGFRRFGWDIFRRFYLDMEIILLCPDVVHFEFGSLSKGRMFLKDFLGTKLSASFRGYDLNFVGLDNPDYYQETWKNIDVCHFLGNDLLKRAIKRGFDEQRPHKLIPPALELRSFPVAKRKSSEGLGLDGHPIHLLSVGRLEWKKGYEHALRTMRLLKDKGIQFEYRIIGDGAYAPALFFLRNQFDLEESVVFTGALSHTEVLSHLQWAEIFLHPSVSEGFCNAVLEAQAMGVPVVCTDADGLAENVLNGVTGYVVPRRDHRAMVEKILSLAKDGALREGMGAAGQKRVQEQFQLSQQIDSFESFYEILLS